jgi:hypothetical protein
MAQPPPGDPDPSGTGPQGGAPSGSTGHGPPAGPPSEGPPPSDAPATPARGPGPVPWHGPPGPPAVSGPVPPGHGFAAPGPPPPHPAAPPPVPGGAGFGPPPHGGPPQPEGPAFPRQSKGCARAIVATVAAVALLMMVCGIWAVVDLTTAGGDFDRTPPCSVGETGELGALVKDADPEIEQKIEGTPGWMSGNECRWGTADDGRSVPASVRLVLVRTDDHSGGEAEEEAKAALRDAKAGNDPGAVKGLGDQAYTWYEKENRFGWGCTAWRTSNLYAMACYTASADYQASESIPEKRLRKGAEDYARSVDTAISKGDYS